MRKNFIFFEAIHASLLKVCNCGIQKAKITKYKQPFVILQSIKTHGSVSYGPRNPGRATDKCALHKSLKKILFLCNCTWTKFPVVGQLAFQIWAESIKPLLPSKFALFSPYFSSFHNTFWYRYNWHILCWIASKFGALLEHIYDAIFVAIR